MGYSTMPVLTPTASLNGRFSLMLDTKPSMGSTIGEHVGRFLLLILLGLSLPGGLCV